MLTDEQLNITNYHENTLLSIIKKINVDQVKFSGYLKIKAFDDYKKDEFKIWYLFFSRGKIVFSGCQLINFNNNFSEIKSYIPNSKDRELVSFMEIEEIMQNANASQNILMIGLLQKLVSNLDDLNTLSYQKIVESIKSYLIQDLEQYFFCKNLEVNIFADTKIDYLRPIVGLEIDKIIEIITSRQACWKKIKTAIPSLKYSVICNFESPQWKQLSSIEKNKIKKIVSNNNTIEEICFKLGEDTLKVAQVFYKLFKNNLICISLEQSSFSEIITSSVIKNITKSSRPKIVVIDDSLVLLKQFSSVVKALGYDVACCNDALNGVEILLEQEPSIVFIDINMPELSGFKLMKQIRSHSKLSSIPTVILTAEKTMMNQQRAKWSKSEFLSKPLSSEDKQRFIVDLKNLLHKIAPIEQ